MTKKKDFNDPMPPLCQLVENMGMIVCLVWQRPGMETMTRYRSTLILVEILIM